MNGWKLWGSLVALFLSGVGVGVVGTWLYADLQMEQRWEGGPQAKQQWIMKRLTRELGLTSEQQAAIEPIVTRTSGRAAHPPGPATASSRGDPSSEPGSDGGCPDVRAAGKATGLAQKLQRRWQKAEAYLRARQQEQRTPPD